MVTPIFAFIRRAKMSHDKPFHVIILIAWLADEASLMCNIVTMGRQIAEMFSTFSLRGCLFLMIIGDDPCEETMQHA